VRGDPEVAYTGIGGQHEVEQGWLPAGAATLLEHVGDGRGADRAPGEGLGERRLQRGSADLIEQAQQARGLAGQGVVTDGQGVEEGLGLRAGVAETIAAPERVRVTLLSGERGEVGLGFDPLPAIVVARVARDLGGAVEDPHGVVRRRRG
jgi:hypothetical protein